MGDELGLTSTGLTPTPTYSTSAEGYTDTSTNPNSVGGSTPISTDSATTTSPISTTSPVQESSATSTSSGLFATSNALYKASGSANAASSTPSASLKTSSSSHGSGKFNTGTLAGSIVGAFVGGFILAAIALFFFRPRRRRSDHSEGPPASALDTSNIQKGPTQSVIRKSPEPVIAVQSQNRLSSFSPGSETSLLDLSPFIPNSADDGAIYLRIQSFFDQASLHVDNYYSRPRSQVSVAQYDVASINEFESSLLGAPIITLLENTRSQRAIITHLLVHKLVQTFQPENQTWSLLPENYRITVNQNQKLDQNHPRALFAWRMLTSYFNSQSHGFRQESPPVPDDAITRIAEHFVHAFEPYSDPQFSEDERMSHLKTVVRTAAELGTWLFSQPCSFEFRWQNPGLPQSQIVVLPAVLKTLNEQGKPLIVPQVIVEESVSQA
ncbi:hypothetical protein N7462_000132 [Penicillium macrosclerotiorum]|uniref:uncharacterized protein n=1 Tax=Penicillium macrosclerotiorum TaxID=303699 RepID=UPI0025475685|nr:uncharacterized protein N7462_000132 [Penicillium macrosclerotiorum]KAJ5698127.1 hypothetical protein N7462_000132 [Penicillium macrosclerotiorum]